MARSAQWNTPASTGPEAEEAKRAIHEEFNSPATFSVRQQRWTPGIRGNVGDALTLLGKAWAKYQRGEARSPVPFYKIDGRTVHALRRRGWVEGRKGLPQLSSLGLRALREFWPKRL